MAIKSERIKEEEIKCQALADIAQADLDEAMPALDEANRVSICVCWTKGTMGSCLHQMVFRGVDASIRYHAD